mgnify:FL=1
MKIDNNFNQTIINSVRPNNRVQKTYGAKTTNSPEIINIEEKQLFANMFPEKKSEVMDYNFYNRNGKVNTHPIGSLFDRRF